MRCGWSRVSRLRLFEERTGCRSLSRLQPLERAESLGLIERDHERVTPTLRGQRFLNELLQLFLPDGVRS